MKSRKKNCHRIKSVKKYFYRMKKFVLRRDFLKNKIILFNNKEIDTRGQGKGVGYPRELTTEQPTKFCLRLWKLLRSIFVEPSAQMPIACFICYSVSSFRSVSSTVLEECPEVIPQDQILGEWTIFLTDIPQALKEWTKLEASSSLQNEPNSLENEEDSLENEEDSLGNEQDSLGEWKNPCGIHKEFRCGMNPLRNGMSLRIYRSNILICLA